MSLSHTTNRRPDSRRWTALAFISLAQLMVVLDATIVNIALPDAQRDLGMSAGSRQWVITAYALAFGGLLLVGGRIADRWGRKRAFTTGLIGFGLASALGGAAQSQAMLFGSRALQGVFGALLAPAALSLLSVTFTDAKERAKAFGIYGALAGAGGAIGLLLGGSLTQYLDWRWTLYINIFFAAIAVAGALVFVHEPAGQRDAAPLDLPGVALASLGLIALVYGFSRAESDGWTSAVTLCLFAGAIVLLTMFIWTESKVRHPLLPLRVVSDRNRAGAYTAVALGIIALFGMFLFLTYYLQIVKGYSPLKTGLAFLPLSASMVVGSTQIGARLMHRLAPRVLIVPGLLLAAGALLLLTWLSVDSPYAALILPAQIMFGLGLGTVFTSTFSLATAGVQPSDAGVASAMVNTSQQVGGAVGTSLLNTVAVSATASFLAGHRAGVAAGKLVQNQALVHGYDRALWWAFGFMLSAAVIAAGLIPSGSRRGAHRAGAAEATTAQVENTDRVPFNVQ